MAEPSVVANAAGAPGAAVAAAAADCETEVLDDEPRNILMGIIAQLRKGMDLHRVTLPTFVLEPRSMCERITDFLAHQDLLLSTPLKSDPVERFVDVVRYFLSGWHIRPKGVKKPFNPVLGEIFRCRWDLDNGTQSFYVCEQVLHHPPVSAYFYASPENGVVITGELRPRARFLGNSAATMMEGGSTVTFTSLDGETYHITPPNMYARGILFGTMYIELGDTATIRCPKTDLVCCIEFKTKGYFVSSENNAISGKIKNDSTGEVIYKILGSWSDQMWLQPSKTSDKQLLFDAASAVCLTKIVHDVSEQEEFESRRLWDNVARAVIARDLDLATVEKTRIEDNQRLIVKDREARGVEWVPRFFEADGSQWKPRFLGSVPSDPAKAKAWLAEFLFASASTEMHSRFWAPADDKPQ